MQELLGIGSALGAAAAYAFGVTLQAIEARETSGEQSLKLSLLRQLVTRPRWIGGTACVALGWILQAVALILAPITIVQPALAISVVVLLVIGMRMHDEGIGSREVIGALAIVAGVTGLAVVAPGQSEGDADPTVLAIGMTALAAVALAPYLLGAANKRTMGLLVVYSAGLAYAWTGFSTKFLADGVSAGDWPVAAAWLGATIGAAGIGLLSEMTALQTRSAIRVFPIVLVVQIVVAVLLAPLLAGETWEPEPGLVTLLAVSLISLTIGTYALCSCRTVSRVVATE